MRPSSVYAYFCLAGSMALVGANIAVGKQVITELPIFLFSALRFAVACIALAPLILLEPGPALSSLKVRDWRDLFLQSFFGVFLFTVLMLYGVSLTSASTAGIVTGALPAVIAILGWLLFRERLRARTNLGIALAAAAIVSLNLGSTANEAGISPTSVSSAGMALVFGAVLSEALFTIFAKRLSDRIPPLRMAFCVNLIGLAMFTPFAIWRGMTFNPGTVSTETWILAVYYALTASVLSFVLWYLGVRQVPASRAALFTAVLPLSATVVSITYLGEPASPIMLMGTLFVMASIWLGTTGRGEETRL